MCIRLGCEQMRATKNHKYQVIARELKKAIMTGKIRPGGVLPSQNELISQYGVSLGTVRQVVRELVSDGWAVTQQGKGIFAQSPTVHPAGESAERKEQKIGFAVIGSYSEYNPPDQMVLHGALAVLKEAGKEIGYSVFPRNERLHDDLAKFCEGISGLILTQIFHQDVLEIARNHSVRAVTVGTMPDEDYTRDFHNVSGDGENAGYLACQALTVYGHEKIGFVYPKDSEYFLAIQRGFIRACEEIGLSEYEVFLQSKSETGLEQLTGSTQMVDLTGLVMGQDTCWPLLFLSECSAALFSNPST